MKDPRYPNRPDHPHFWRLSEAVIANDAKADADGAGTAFDSLGVDRASVEYMATQRLTLAMQHNFIGPEARALLVALWIDGFAAGLGYERTPVFVPPADLSKFGIPGISDEDIERFNNALNDDQ